MIFGEGMLEETADVLQLPLLPERRTEEDSPKQVNDLNLSNVFLVLDGVVEDLAQGLHDVGD